MPRLQFQLQAPVTFRTDVAIYISHVNPGGHLDHAQLLTLLSEARVRFFQSLGYREADVEGCPIVVGDLGVQYLSEGFHGETLRIEMAPAERSRCGFDLQFRMHERDSGREVARGKTGIVFTDRASRRAVPIPPAFLARLGGA